MFKDSDISRVNKKITVPIIKAFIFRRKICIFDINETKKC